MEKLEKEVNGECQASDSCSSKENYEEIRIPVPWGHIAGKWWGSQLVQPIIAIHGWQDNCGTFDTLAPLLSARGHSLLCIDLPGHGFSSHLPVGQNYYLWWDGIHYLRRIVKYYNWKNLELLGHSLGGGISFLYAASFPEDVKRYISIDIVSPSVRHVKKSIDHLGQAIDKFLKYETLPSSSLPSYVYKDMLELVYDAYRGDVTQKGCEIMLKRGMQPVPGSDKYVFTRDPRLKIAALGFLSIEQVLEFASRIKCEVLNIRAKQGLKFDVPEHYDLVLDQIEKSAKKLERYTIEGTHHLHLNDPENIVDIVHNFYSSKDELL